VCRVIRKRDEDFEDEKDTGVIPLNANLYMIESIMKRF
jgi:hypothetical protein